MVNIKKVIGEEVREFRLDEICKLLESIVPEGIADKSAEKLFGITDPNKELNHRATQGMEKNDPMGTFVGNIGEKSKIYLNPKNLKNFEPNVRAISNKEQQLFVAQLDGEFLHYMMGITIKKAGYNIGSGAYDDVNNITWIRVKSTDIFGLAESMESYYRDDLDGKKYEDVVKRTEELQKVHPEFRFIPKIYWEISENGSLKDLELDEVSQTVDEIIEGIADRYAEKEFNIPNSGAEQDKKATMGMEASNSMGEYVGDVDNKTDWDDVYGEKHPEVLARVFANPRNLNDFGKQVRAISDDKGNLFVADTDGRFFHDNLKHTVEISKYGNGETNYMEWYRQGLTNMFAWSATYSNFSKFNPEVEQQYVQAVKARNPQYKFLTPKIQEVEQDVDEIIEGVADRYAEKEFNIPDPNTQMDKQATAAMPVENSASGKLVGVMPTYDHGKYLDVKIYLNPGSLQDFDADVKAVSTKDGDLLVADLDLAFYHSDLTSNVRAKKIYTKPLYNAYDESENITWHRIGTTNDFGWSISYKSFGTDPENQQEVREHTDAVKAKNPKFNFISRYWEEVKRGRYDDENNINTDDLYNGPANGQASGPQDSYPIYSNMSHNQNR